MTPRLPCFLTASRWLASAIFGLALVAGPTARAQTVYALGTLTADFLGTPAGSQGLTTIDPATGVAGAATPIAGVPANQKLVV